MMRDCKSDGMCRTATICFLDGCQAHPKACIGLIEDRVSAVIKRANQLAPNSNFKIDGGIDGVKYRNVIQAILEHFDTKDTP